MVPGGAVLPAESGRLEEHAHIMEIYILQQDLVWRNVYAYAKKELNKEAKPTQLPANQAQSWEITKYKKI